VDIKKQYAKDYQLHKESCDGEGYLWSINRFTGNRTWAPCRFCKIVNAYKERKRDAAHKALLGIEPRLANKGVEDGD
jgi:hypothetical protein